jgi:Fic family protein
MASSTSFKATPRIRWRDTPREPIRQVGKKRALFNLVNMLPGFVWNAAALEGNTFTLPEVRTLLDGVTVGGKSLAEQQQILDLSEAFNLLHHLVSTGEFSLDKATSDRLHRPVARNEALEAGAFRGEGQVSGDGGGVRLMSGGSVPFDPAEDLFDDHADLLSALKHIDDPVEKALAYFCSATRSQFYFDGNKRTARLMASGALMSAGYPALNIPNARRLEFNLALDTLFTTDDASQLMDFLWDCLLEGN